MFAVRVITLLMLLLALKTDSQAQDFVNIFDLEWSPDGTILAVSSSSGVLLYDTADFNAEPRTLPLTEDEGIPLIAFDPMTGALLASNTTELQDAELLLFDPVTAAVLPSDEQLPPHTGGSGEAILDIAFAPDGSYVAAIDSSLHFYPRSRDVRSPSLPVLPSSDMPYALAFHPAEPFLALGAGFEEGKLYIAAVPAQGEPDSDLREIELGYTVQQVGWSPDGAYLAVQGIFNPLTLYDSETLEEIPLGIDATLDSYGFAFSPGGFILASGGSSVIRYYRLPDREIIELLSLPGGDPAAAFALAFSPDGTLLASIDTVGDLLIWDAVTGELLHDIGNFDGGFNRRWG